MTELFIGSDHAGFDLKNKIKIFLQDKFKITDLGTYSQESCDYPVYSELVAKRVQENASHLGILICGSGIGVSLVANRFKNIRAARCVSLLDAQLAKEHNNANVLCLGARINSWEEHCAMIELWLNSKFESRHQKRLDLFSDKGL